MFKLCVFLVLIAIASAGLIPLDSGIGLGGIGLGGIGLGGIGLGGHGVAIAAPVAVKAGATSYQNSNLLALHPTPVITKAVAAPVITKVAAPIALASPAVGLLGGLGYHGI